MPQRTAQREHELETTRGGAEMFAQIERSTAPMPPMTFLDAKWQEAEARCREEDAKREQHGRRVERKKDAGRATAADGLPASLPVRHSEPVRQATAGRD